MQINITIDTIDLFEGLHISTQQQEDFVDRVVKDYTALFASHLEVQAQNDLKTSRNAYIRNIKVIDSGRMEGTVLLDYTKEPLVRMVEEGQDAFDMKQYFLKSSKVKVGKDGKRFLTIPFRFAAPGSLGESDVFQSKLPKDIHSVIKNYPQLINLPGGGTRSKGLLLSDMSERYQEERGIRFEVQDNKGNLFAEYEHKNSIFEGLVRKKDAVTGQFSYHNFRRVSENSDPNSWIHTGIEKRGIMDKALASFPEETISASIDKIFQQMGFE